MAKLPHSRTHLGHKEKPSRPGRQRYLKRPRGKTSLFIRLCRKVNGFHTYFPSKQRKKSKSTSSYGRPFNRLCWIQIGRTPSFGAGLRMESIQPKALTTSNSKAHSTDSKSCRYGKPKRNLNVNFLHGRCFTRRSSRPTI